MLKRITEFSLINFRIGNWSAIACLFVFSLLLIGPAAYFGIPENYDLGQHLRFARTYFDAFSNGTLLPSWGAADNNGFGSVGVRFYPPLAHMVMGVIQFGSHSWYDTLWLSMLLWMFVACCGTYFLAKEWLTPNQALLTALLYAIVPYHLLQVFQAFLLAEFVGAAILPFCFLYAYRVVKRGQWIDSLLFAAAFSALILSHIPSTIMGSISLGVFVLCLLNRDSLLRTVTRFAAAFALSLATTAFYWLRMVTELAWVKHNTSEYYAAGFYNYSTYFFPMFLNSREVYIQRFLWLLDTCIVLTYTLFIPIIVVAIINRRKAKDSSERHIFALSATGLFALFMMSSASTFLWNNISFIQKLQFPYRWLGPASLMASLLFPIGVIKLIKRQTKVTRPLAYSLALIFTLVMIFDVTQIVVPSAPIPREEIAKLVDSINVQPGCECWWPIWGKNDALKNAEKVTVNGRSYSVEQWDATERQFTLTAGTAGNVRIATFYYPRWTANVNGQPANVEKADDGSILIAVPEQASNVSLSFRETDGILASRIISLIGWFFLIGGLILLIVRRKRSNIPAEIVLE